MGAWQNQNDKPTSKVIQDYFPKLWGTTIASEYGVEDVTPLHIPADVRTSATATTITTMQSTTTTRAVTHGSIPEHDNGDYKYKTLILTIQYLRSKMTDSKMTAPVLMLIPFLVEENVMSKNCHLWLCFVGQQVQMREVKILRSPLRAVCVTIFFRKS